MFQKIFGYNTVLSPIIEKSASLARISAAISIHNGIYSKKSIVQEVTAEFLDISPSVAKELLAHDYRSLSDNMNKFHGSLSKIPTGVKNGDELIKTINLLLDMKIHQEYLKPGAIGDQTAHFSKTTEIIKKSKESNGLKVKSVTKATTPYAEVSTCIETLRPIQNPPDQAMLQRIVKFSEEVVKNVKTFSNLMDSLNNNDLKLIKAFSKEIKTNIELVTRANNDSLNIEMWDKTRKLENDHKLADKFQSIADNLDDVAKQNPFLEDRTIDYTVIRAVSTVFDGTNVESVLNCIKRSSVDNLHVATNFISNLLKIRRSFQNVIGKVKSAKVSKDSKLLIDSRHFKDVGPHSRVIGGSLAALRAIESVLKAEKSIKSVIDMDAEAKSSIQKSLGLKSTDTLINEMQQAETSVGEILKILNTKSIDSIPQIQSILNSLSQLKNHMDIKDDNIPSLALLMAKQKDTKIQSLAQDLLTISSLDMRFEEHLKAFEVQEFIGDNQADAEETMNFWDWLNTDEAEELIWNISWYFTVGWVTFWVLFALSETICNIMFKRDFFFLKSPDHPDKQKERIGSAKQAEEKKAWMKNEEKKKNKKDKKEKNEKKMENPKKVKRMGKWFK
ncbi:unnamed protein product [Caenorhabditis nigoni]